MPKNPPLDEINPVDWNKDFFKDTQEFFNSEEAVAVIILGSNPPNTGKTGMYCMTAPGVGKEMAIVALKSAIRNLESGNAINLLGDKGKVN